MPAVSVASDPGATMRLMFEAVLICSDDRCAERFEATGSLEELDALACDCGCALIVLTLGDAPEPQAVPMLYAAA